MESYEHMRFLVDEGCDAAIVSVLRELGHDVLWVAEDAPGTTDADILAWGLRDQRLIVHHDLDFGELIFRDHLPSHGVILVRIPDPQREIRAARVREVLERYDEAALLGAITRVTPKRMSRTPLKADQRHTAPHHRKAAQDGTAAPPALTPDVPRYEDWKTFALAFDGETLCRQMGIRPTAWYAQQMKQHKQTGTWNLALWELRLMLYLEANKVKYNGGVENRARVESLLAAVREKI